MQKEQIKSVHGEKDALAIYEEVKASGDFVSFAKDYAFDEDHIIARNALWVLTKSTKRELANLQPLMNDLIEQAMRYTNSAVCRLSLNIIERLTIKEEDLRTDFLDFCLEHMAKVDELPGVQSICLKLAFKMCKFYDELMGELVRTLEAMEMDYYTPAIKSVRNKILRGNYK